MGTTPSKYKSSAWVLFISQLRNAGLAASALAKAASLSAPVLAMNCRWSKAARKAGSLSMASRGVSAKVPDGLRNVSRFVRYPVKSPDLIAAYRSLAFGAAAYSGAVMEHSSVAANSDLRVEVPMEVMWEVVLWVVFADISRKWWEWSGESTAGRVGRYLLCCGYLSSMARKRWIGGGWAQLCAKGCWTRPVCRHRFLRLTNSPTPILSCISSTHPVLRCSPCAASCRWPPPRQLPPNPHSKSCP